jgi:hypothetical protein
VLACACSKRGHQLVRAAHDRLAGGVQLQRERRVEHVGGGQPEVDPAPGLTYGASQHVNEGGHVVVGHTLSLGHLRHGEGGGPDGREVALAGAVLCEQRGQLLAGGHLDPAPGLHAGLVGPKAG